MTAARPSPLDPAPAPTPLSRERFALLDHVLVRVNGLPFHEPVPVAHAGAAARLRRMRALVDTLAAHRDALCDAIFAAVQRQHDPRAVRDLVTLKRDVFAARPSKVPLARVAALAELP